MMKLAHAEFGLLHPLVLEADKIGAMVAGGSLRRIKDGTDLHDIDLFFKDKKHAALTEAYFTSRKAETVFKCPKGELTTLKLLGVKIQFCMVGFYSDMDALLDTFDFDCTRFGLHEGIVTFDEKAEASAKSKTLTIHKLTYPAATLHRMQKYVSYGYTIPAETAQRFVDLIAENPEIAANNRVYVD